LMMLLIRLSLVLKTNMETGFPTQRISKRSSWLASLSRSWVKKQR
jgi:hypothetical protein